MKISNTSLDELIMTLIGEDVLPLVHILQNKNNISEFKLAEMLNVTVNQIRNMLYRLNEQNLVNFIRKKDKKKGWYIYYWSLNEKSLENSSLKVKYKQLEDLKTRFARESEGMFYVCPMGCMRLSMEQAMEYEFRCQECGTLMKEQDNQKTISNIQKMITDLEQELKAPQEEKLKKSAEKKKVPEKKESLKIAVKKKAAVKKIIPKKEVKKKSVKKVVPKKEVKKKV